MVAGKFGLDLMWSSGRFAEYNCRSTFNQDKILDINKTLSFEQRFFNCLWEMIFMLRPVLQSQRLGFSDVINFHVFYKWTPVLADPVDF
jgi:hypothetical protein